eukprot:1172472-Pyramimonas_sp.AAC.1
MFQSNTRARALSLRSPDSAVCLPSTCPWEYLESRSTLRVRVPCNITSFHWSARRAPSVFHSIDRRRTPYLQVPTLVPGPTCPDAADQIRRLSDQTLSPVTKQTTK